MKKTTIGMVLLCAILLGSCTKEAEMKNEALPQNTETTMDAFKPMTFEQTRALVGEVLGSDVAERIEPTNRYVRVQFDDANLMCEYYMRGAAELSPVPLLGEQVAEAAVSDDKPRPMYALIDRDIALPEHAECEVLAEYFDVGTYGGTGGKSLRSPYRLHPCDRSELVSFGGHPNLR